MIISKRMDIILGHNVRDGKGTCLASFMLPYVPFTDIQGLPVSITPCSSCHEPSVYKLDFGMIERRRPPTDDLNVLCAEDVGGLQVFMSACGAL